VVDGYFGNSIEQLVSFFSKENKVDMKEADKIIELMNRLKDKKKDFYAGEMTYKQGLISGIILSVFIALLSPLTQWITSTIITPEYFPNVIAYSVETGYHKSIEEVEAYFNLKNYIVQSTIGALIMGILTTAIAMIFIRSKK
ncbi:hypothetical protein LCGC14_2267590, partial [marine sediment metagenome]